MNDTDAQEARERTYSLWLELGAPASADDEEPDRGRRHMPGEADPRRSEGDVARDDRRCST